MSFMFNPYPYDDPKASNPIDLSEKSIQSITCGNANVIKELCNQATKGVLIIDGYIGIDFDATITPLKQELGHAAFLDIASCYKTQAQLDQMLDPYLAVDSSMDPVSLFGRIYHGEIDDLLDKTKLADLLEQITQSDKPVIVYGCGSGCQSVRQLADRIVYLDIAPKNIVLRAKAGKIKCIGDETNRPFKQLLRHLYYVEYEVSMRLRQELLNDKKLIAYIDSNDPEEHKFIPKLAFEEIFEHLVNRPFRCKPCYIEGVWGGDYIKNLRNLPEKMRNCAWVFDLIPNEVSLVAKTSNMTFEFPYVTFYRKMGIKLMGKDTVEKYGGGFPIRFNYDDGVNGGNMSIQVHPTRKYNNENFNEPFQQDESYYIVHTTGSRTYMGIRDKYEPKEFYDAVQKSEKDGSEVDYEKYVNSIVSRQGRQFLLPGGTLHSSGVNQVVLEIGCWTVGSYTFKMYDYLRTDLDGTRRPIHSKHGINVIDTSRNEEYVKTKLVPERKILDKGDDWTEFIVGEHEKMFFQLRCIELYTQVQSKTNGKFHVLNLVEGQKARIESLDDSSAAYEIEYLEMVVVPACLGRYRIINMGAGPITIHKTLLKSE